MNLLSKIEELSDIINGYCDDSLKNDLIALKDKVAQNKLYVVVVGLFKRGKSTLINSLLEKNILPSSVTPVTALITIVEFSEKPSAQVYFTNGQVKNIEIESVEEYVAEEKNPDNQKKVNYVRIFENASRLLVPAFPMCLSIIVSSETVLNLFAIIIYFLSFKT